MWIRSSQYQSSNSLFNIFHIYNICEIDGVSYRSIFACILCQRKILDISEYIYIYIYIYDLTLVICFRCFYFLFYFSIYNFILEHPKL